MFVSLLPRTYTHYVSNNFVCNKWLCNEIIKDRREESRKKEGEKKGTKERKDEFVFNVKVLSQWEFQSYRRSSLKFDYSGSLITTNIKNTFPIMTCIFREERKKILNRATLYFLIDVCLLQFVQGNKHRLRVIREFYSSLSRSFDTPCLVSQD